MIRSSPCRRTAIGRPLGLVRRNPAPPQIRRNINMFAKTTVAILPALAILGFAAAHAAPASVASLDPAVMSITVSVADLNLDSRAGAKTALQRIHAAAKT